MWGRARNSLSYLFPLKMLWAIFSDTPIFRILNRTISMYTIPPATVTSTQTFSGAMRDRAETHCKRHLRDFNCSTRKSFLVLSIFFDSSLLQSKSRKLLRWFPVLFQVLSFSSQLFWVSKWCLFRVCSFQCETMCEFRCSDCYHFPTNIDPAK